MKDSIDDLRGKTIGIIGAKGTGKTYLTRKLIEGVRDNIIVFDTIGVLKPAGDIVTYNIQRGNLEEQAITFGIVLKGSSKRKRGVAINFSGLTREETILFVDIALEVAGRIEGKYIFVDEIAELLSQEYKQSRELERLIRHGRNFGNTFVFNTQRPAYLNKNTWNLVDVLIVFRISWNNDIKTLREVLSNLGKPQTEIDKIVKEITNQKVGECLHFLF